MKVATPKLHKLWMLCPEFALGLAHIQQEDYGIYFNDRIMLACVAFHSSLQTPDTRHQTPDTRHQTPGTRHQTLSTDTKPLTPDDTFLMATALLLGSVAL